jgi:hypothetical protein
LTKEALMRDHEDVCCDVVVMIWIAADNNQITTQNKVKKHHLVFLDTKFSTATTE